MNPEIVVAIAIVVIGGIVVYVLLTKKSNVQTAAPVALPAASYGYPTAPPQNYRPGVTAIPQPQPDWLKTTNTVVAAIPGVVSAIDSIAGLFS